MLSQSNMIKRKFGTCT